MSTSSIIIIVVILTILIFLSALFSAAETAYSSLAPAKLKIELKKGKKSALLINKHYKSFGWTLSTILISNNLVNVSSAALLTYLFSSLLGGTSMVTIISTFVMTPILVIFGEITPKLLAKKYSYGYLAKIAYLIELFNWIFLPFTFPITKMSLASKVTTTEKELKTIIKIAKEEGVLEKKEATLATNALDLDSRIVKDIMTLRKSVVSIKKGTRLDVAIQLFKRTGFSRIPVTSKNKFLGVLILKDIILSKEEIIDKYIIEVARISQNKIVSNALEILRSSRSHMAFIYKTKSAPTLIGILTLEDIVEELIGEIYDEHDKYGKIKEIGLHKFEAKGSVKMSKVSEMLNIKFENNTDITLKKWLQSHINRKVKEGLSYTYKKKYIFKVVENKNNQETIIKIIQK